MTSINRNLSNSEVYASISSIPMGSGERKAALEALQVGELIADVILTVGHYLRLLVAVPALKPSFKPLKPSFRL